MNAYWLEPPEEYEPPECGKCDRINNGMDCPYGDISDCPEIVSREERERDEDEAYCEARYQEMKEEGLIQMKCVNCLIISRREDEDYFISEVKEAEIVFDGMSLCIDHFEARGGFY